MRIQALLLSLSLATPAFGAVVKFDKTSGNVEWVGKKNVAGNEHRGNILVKAGSLDLAAKKGEFVIDMTTIEPTDLTKAEDKKKLRDHLSNEDFFLVEKYPEAKFVVKDITPVAGQKDLYDVKGELTIRGVTRPETIKATITENGKQTSVSSKFTFSRTAYGVTYSSEAEVKKKAEEAKKEESVLAKAGKAVKDAADKAVRQAGDKWIVDEIELNMNLKSL